MPEIIQFVLTSETSDLLLFLATPVVAWFTIAYAFGSPWWTHPLGVVTLLMSLSTCGLLLLIDYAMITGGRIDEWARTLVALGLLFAAIGKVAILHVAQQQGKIERRHRRHAAAQAASENGEGVNHGD